MEAAFWVLQFSVFSFVITIFSVPYTASIIANEKMKTFALIGIIEVFLKLGVVFILIVIPNDKLISYSILLFFVTLAVSISSVLYSKKKLQECQKFALYWDKELFLEMSRFAGWNLVGVSAGIAYNQGVNILLNVYFGPVVNAARGIAFQVQSALNSFVGNFQVAINPSITKEYAKNDLESSFKLVFMASKISYFLLLLLSMPVILETDTILLWWLKVVPDYTIAFTRLVIFDILVGSISGSIQSLIQATGKIKVYQIIISGILLLNLPISFIFIKLGFKPEYTFYVSIILTGVALFFRLWIINYLIKFPSVEFFKSTLIRIFVVSAVSFMAIKVVYSYFSEFYLSFLILCSISFFFVSIFIYFLGLNNLERNFVTQKIKFVLNKY
jgi:O-antigen/teichoic acid export membrane protein